MESPDVQVQVWTLKLKFKVSVSCESSDKSYMGLTFEEVVD